ncbi:MAG: glycosyltransferase family 4 protein [Candidatus Pacearchaeota archaeon]
MKNIYLLAGMHPVFETYLRYPPNGINYISNISLEAYTKIKIYQKGLTKIKKAILSKIQYRSGLPRFYYITDKKLKNCELIHSNRAFIPLNNKPYVVDFEHSVTFGRMKWLLKALFKSKRCRALLPHCEAAKYSLLNYLDCHEFKNKIHTVYLAIKNEKIKKVPRDEKFTILNISGMGAFYRKGCHILLDAYDILKKSYDIKIMMRANVPQPYLEKYKNDKNVEFIQGFISKEKIYEEFYFKGDILVMPSFIDSFGYPLLEAMNAGLPCIASKIFAIPEIIKEDKNGFLIKLPFSLYRKDFLALHQCGQKDLTDKQIMKYNFCKVAKELAKKVAYLIEHDRERKKMGREGKKMIKEKFSVEVRNEKIKKIYEEAIG